MRAEKGNVLGAIASGCVSLASLAAPQAFPNLEPKVWLTLFTAGLGGAGLFLVAIAYERLLRRHLKGEGKPVPLTLFWVFAILTLASGVWYLLDRARPLDPLPVEPRSISANPPPIPPEPNIVQPPLQRAAVPLGVAAQPQKEVHHSRSLSLRDLMPVFAQNPDGAVLLGVRSVAVNAGVDQLRLSLVAVMTLEGNAKFTVSDGGEIYLAPSDQAQLSSMMPSPVAIPSTAKEIILETTAEYDTVPATAKRVSRRTIAFPLTWNGAQLTMEPGRVVFQDEK